MTEQQLALPLADFAPEVMLDDLDTDQLLAVFHQIERIALKCTDRDLRKRAAKAVDALKGFTDRCYTIDAATQARQRAAWANADDIEDDA